MTEATRTRLFGSIASWLPDPPPAAVEVQPLSAMAAAATKAARTLVLRFLIM